MLLSCVCWALKRGCIYFTTICVIFEHARPYFVKLLRALRSNVLFSKMFVFLLRNDAFDLMQFRVYLELFYFHHCDLLTRRSIKYNIANYFESQVISTTNSCLLWHQIVRECLQFKLLIQCSIVFFEINLYGVWVKRSHDF